MQLYPYQEEGVTWLADRRTGLLADEPGLGKTIQALEAVRTVGAKRATVIAPASVTPVWRQKHREMGCQFDLQAVSYGARGIPPGDVLILDEAHYLKNQKAQRTRKVYGENCAMGGVFRDFERTFALSGTPAPNHSGEIWSTARALFPAALAPHNGLRDVRSYWAFLDRYCRTQDNGFGLQIVGSKNTAELRARLEPYVLRRRKVDVLTDLPPLTVDILPLTAELPEPEAGDAERIARALQSEGVAGLSKIAPHVATLRRYTGLAKVAALLNWVGDWLGGSEGKIVLFAHHVEVLQALERGLAGHGPVATITGGSTGAQREQAVTRFQEDPKVRVFLGQILAAGTGLTLTAADTLVFAESSWVPAENEQAALRIHRIGQRNACTVYFATVAGSLDERVAAACARKLRDTKELFG